jgi:hypothetical protein
LTAETTSVVVAAICAVTCLAFWLWLVAVPVAKSFDGGMRRTIAVVLSTYTLFIGVGIGAGVGLLVAYHWDEIGTWFGG